MRGARGRPRPARRFPRLTLRVDVVLESAAESRRSVATTLGAGGLFVGTPTPWPPNTALVAHLKLPDSDEWLALEARVAWAHAPEAVPHAPGMGLEFLDRGARAELAARLEHWAAARESEALSGGEGS